MQKSLSTPNSEHPLVAISLSFLTSSTNAARCEGSWAGHEPRRQPEPRTVHSAAWFYLASFLFCSRLLWTGSGFTHTRDWQFWQDYSENVAPERARRHCVLLGEQPTALLTKPAQSSVCPGRGFQPPPRLLKAMTVLKALLVIHRNIAIAQKASGELQ